MWVPKKKWQQLEKRIADLEVQVQGQRSKWQINTPRQTTNKPVAHGVAKLCWETEGVGLDLDKPIQAIVAYAPEMPGFSAEIYQD